MLDIIEELGTPESSCMYFERNTEDNGVNIRIFVNMNTASFTGLGLVKYL